MDVVVDASANYGSHLTVYNFMAGPQLTVDKQRPDLFRLATFRQSRGERFGVEPTQIVWPFQLGTRLRFRRRGTEELALQACRSYSPSGLYKQRQFQLSQNNLRISTWSGLSVWR